MHLADVDGFFVFLHIKRRFGHHLAFFLWHFQHVVVKAGDGDVVVFVGERSNHLCKNVDGIGHRAAKEAGVQVAVGTGYFHLHVSQPAQPGGDGRNVGSYHAGVGNQDDVGLEHLFVLLAEVAQAGRAYLFFAFNHKLYVTG